MTSEPGVVYMLHYELPIGNTLLGRVAMAQHYTGWYADPSRISYHRNGTSGVHIVRAFHLKGISFVVARTRKGTKADERVIKNAGGATRYCPICTNGSPRTGVWGPYSEEGS